MTRLQSEYLARCQRPSDISMHLPVLFETVSRYEHATVIELGVRDGNSTAAFLAGVEAVDGHLWSVDIEAPRVPHWWAATGFWTLGIGDDLDRNIASALPECDVLFIDTSHWFDQTLAELRLYCPKVKAGGVVLLHDTEWCPEHEFPVARALDEFSPGWKNLPGSYGLGVISPGLLDAMKRGKEQAA